MKLSTSKLELQSVLQKASKAIPTRSTLPVLSCVLFDVQEKGIILRTTDLEITITVNLAASIEQPGNVAIPLQTLVEITNELPEDARITIAANENNKIEMVTEVGSYDIMGKPADEFPALPEVDNRKEVGISGEALSTLISKTAFAVSRDELKPALTGVLFRFEKDKLTGVATDGHRLVRYVRNDYKAEDYTGDIIVPRKFLSLLSGALGGKNSIQMWMGDNHMTAAIGGDTYFTRIIDERFPDFESVIPQDNDKELLVNPSALLSAVRRVSIFSNKSTHQIALRMDREKIQITTEDPEKSSRAQEKIDGEFSGEELVIGYNASYLKDILSHLGDENAIIKLKTPISATLFYPGTQNEKSNLTMLLMPIRLND
ncbi:MAG: DNA polymerase III subunit beta [Candidatus Marinimicrobia bacterium]|jgi:DNA polymerase-3 subunit beta|nr:DNA polymerase III subunit beta [Candidatus Neomarinimicrobiota bacterium]|tara:strand:+ start:559 stop:1677 length:1119 start_codon:yes stop_codon:yes gene_type:complete